MTFTIDHNSYKTEQVWDWLITNVGISHGCTMTTSVGDGWELSILTFYGDQGKVRITIYDVASATAFALRFL